jgi:hypothetical protein
MGFELAASSYVWITPIRDKTVLFFDAALLARVEIIAKALPSSRFASRLSRRWVRLWNRDRMSNPFSYCVSRAKMIAKAAPAPLKFGRPLEPA